MIQSLYHYVNAIRHPVTPIAIFCTARHDDRGKSPIHPRGTQGSMTEVSPIQRRKLSQEVFDRLIQRINAGEFPPGAYLPAERHLMETYRVGRPAVREAVQDLQRMGLVIITHGEGARILEPNAQSVLEQISETVHHILGSSQQNLSQLKEARIFFEVGMVRLAAARTTPEAIEDLRAIVANMEASVDEFATFMKHDIRFHRRIAEMTGNQIYVAVSDGLLQWLSRYHSGEVRKVGREVQTLVEHRTIVERLEARDVEGAAAAMVAHQTRAADNYRPTKNS